MSQLLPVTLRRGSLGRGEEGRGDPQAQRRKGVRAPAVLIAVAMASIWPLSTRAVERVATIPLIAQSVRDRLVLHRKSYNYGPEVVHDGAIYHLYWCGGVAGDYILHSTAPDLSGPWRQSWGWLSSTFETALKPTGSPADFDGLHTCDPSVLKIGATFYLYYTGEASDGALGSIGVASSLDGSHFTRLNGGKPIVVAARTNPASVAGHLSYGAGQPGVTFIAPYVYLSFTDSTGSGANPGNGAGQFVLRSSDPAFGRDVEELTAAGWIGRAPGTHTAEYAWLDSFGVDLAYDPATKLILAVTDRVAGRATLLALEPDRFTTRGSGDLALAWHEGPALVAEADRSMASRADCGRLDIGVLAAEGASADPFSWHDFGYSAAVFSMAAFCPSSR